MTPVRVQQAAALRIEEIHHYSRKPAATRQRLMRISSTSGSAARATAV